MQEYEAGPLVGDTYSWLEVILSVKDVPRCLESTESMGKVITILYYHRTCDNDEWCLIIIARTLLIC